MVGLPGKENNSNTLQLRSLVIYENQGKAFLGLIRDFHHNKYEILNQSAGTSNLTAARLHLIPSSLETLPESDKERASFLSETQEKAVIRGKEIDLEEIWNLIREDYKEITPEELTALYFGENKGPEHLALYLRLVDDKIFFKRNKNAFVPRSEETVEELKKAEAARDRKQKLREITVSNFELRLKDKNHPLPSEIDSQINLLRRLAAESRSLDAGSTKEAKKLLTNTSESLKLNLSGAISKQAHSLLRRLEVLSPFSNLSLIRNDFPAAPDLKAAEAAESVTILQSLNEYPDREVRQDLTELYAITVDDASTKDMDDALSLEKTDSGYRLGIHISDVASIVTPGSELDRSALEKGTSLYFPDRTINMLPDSLSGDKLSLLADTNRPCLSCIVDIDDCFDIVSWKIVSSLINVKKRYTYNEVDHLLETEQDRLLEDIFSISSTLEAGRIADGAFNMPRKNIMVETGPDYSIKLLEIDEGSAARNLVGELMVLANRCFGEYCRDNGINAIFRTQEDSSEAMMTDEQLQEVPEGPARNYCARNGFRPTKLMTGPGRHFALALDCYLQATSPIRRYHDLINQRQIYNHLVHGAPLYNQEEVEGLMKEAEMPLQIAGTVSRETRRFWFFKYLERRVKKNPELKATVLKTDGRYPMVELDEICYPYILRTNEKLKVGDELILKLHHINAAFNDMQTQVVRKITT